MERVKKGESEKGREQNTHIEKERKAAKARECEKQI
jgi:hypothetical protein